MKFYNAIKLEKGIKEKNKIYFKIGKYAYLAFVFEPNKVYRGNLTIELITSQLEELKSHLTKKKIPFTDISIGRTGIIVVDPIGNSLVFVD